MKGPAGAGKTSHQTVVAQAAPVISASAMAHKARQQRQSGNTPAAAPATAATAARSLGRDVVCSAQTGDEAWRARARVSSLAATAWQVCHSCAAVLRSFAPSGRRTHSLARDQGALKGAGPGLESASARYKRPRSGSGGASACTTSKPGAGIVTARPTLQRKLAALMPKWQAAAAEAEEDAEARARSLSPGSRTAASAAWRNEQLQSYVQAEGCCGWARHCRLTLLN